MGVRSVRKVEDVVKTRRTSEIAAEVVAALMKGPRILRDLCDMVGVQHRHSGDLRKYVESFRASGVVRIARWARHDSPVYEWQTKPFDQPDAPRPERGVR